MQDLNSLKKFSFVVDGDQLGENLENIEIVLDGLKFLAKLSKFSLELSGNKLGYNPKILRFLVKGMKDLSSIKMLNLTLSFDKQLIYPGNLSMYNKEF